MPAAMYTMLPHASRFTSLSPLSMRMLSRPSLSLNRHKRRACQVSYVRVFQTKKFKCGPHSREHNETEPTSYHKTSAMESRPFMRCLEQDTPQAGEVNSA